MIRFPYDWPTDPGHRGQTGRGDAQGTRGEPEPTRAPFGPGHRRAGGARHARGAFRDLEGRHRPNRGTLRDARHAQQRLAWDGGDAARQVRPCAQPGAARHAPQDAAGARHRRRLPRVLQSLPRPGFQDGGGAQEQDYFVAALWEGYRANNKDRWFGDGVVGVPTKAILQALLAGRLGGRQGGPRTQPQRVPGGIRPRSRRSCCSAAASRWNGSGAPCRRSSSSPSCRHTSPRPTEERAYFVSQTRMLWPFFFPSPISASVDTTQLCSNPLRSRSSMPR